MIALPIPLCLIHLARRASYRLACLLTPPSVRRAIRARVRRAIEGRLGEVTR